jgi:hypothetical protein
LARFTVPINMMVWKISRHKKPLLSGAGEGEGEGEGFLALAKLCKAPGLQERLAEHVLGIRRSRQKMIADRARC